MFSSPGGCWVRVAEGEGQGTKLLDCYSSNV